MLSYKTLATSAEVTLAEKKSQFIAYASPITSEDEVSEILTRIRKKYWDANHHVYAYALRNGVYRSSDDGEPSGSAGAPVLETLTVAGLTDALVVVTRYFGGTLLGVGGLIRAYSGAARAAIAEAKIAEKKLCHEYSLELDYATWNKVRRAAAGYKNTDIEYGERITVRFLIESAAASAFETLVTDATAGGGALIELGKGYY